MKRRKKASGENMNHVLLDAYDTAIERINRQKPGLRELAMQVLSWITCAKRPLTTSELQHALATKRNKPVLDPGDLPQIGDMVSVCAGLVTVDQQSDLIRLVHYTTQEYFDANRTLFSNAEANITATCVTYLSFDVYESGFCPTDEEIAERIRLKPFYDYSAQYWTEHALKTSTLCQEVIEFLESDTKVQLSGQLLIPWTRRYTQNDPVYMTGLHLAAYLGIMDGVQVLINRNPVDPRDNFGRTPPLLYAAKKGQEAIVELLLSKADVGARDLDDRTPLSYAAEQGHEAVVKLLIDTGKVDVDKGNVHGRIPLSWAAEQGHEDVVKLLLDTGKVNIDEALSRASKKGHKAVFKLILKYSSWYRRSSSFAARI